MYVHMYVRMYVHTYTYVAKMYLHVYSCQLHTCFNTYDLSSLFISKSNPGCTNDSVQR